MWQNLLIPIGIMVTLFILSWLTQMLKNVQQRQEAEKERKRREALPPAMPIRQNQRQREPEPAARPGASDVDRFLAEIDRLRQRSAGGPAVPTTPAAVPVVKSASKSRAAAANKPKKPTRLSEQSAPAPFVTTAPEPAQRSSVRPLISSIEDGSIGGVSGALSGERRTGEAAASAVTHPQSRPASRHATSVTHVATPTTAFGRQLVALLATPQSLPVAVVLTEILGEPKCRKQMPEAGS